MTEISEALYRVENTQIPPVRVRMTRVPFNARRKQLNSELVKVTSPDIPDAPQCLVLWAGGCRNIHW